MSRLLSRPPGLVLAFVLVLCASAARLTAGDVVVTVQDAKGVAVADAVVSLVALDPPGPVAPPLPAEPAVIVQQGEEFKPYVTAVRVGARISFPNQDKVRHQVYSISKTKPFEIPLYGPGAEQAVVFDKPGIVALGCNIHDWMSAYVVVLETPHFMTTPASGLARLAQLPPGRYRLEVWHPRLVDETRREVVVSTADDTQAISVTLKADKRMRRAPDSAGGGYK